MTPERYDKLKFDLWMALNAVRHADWFTAQLFRLFSKADSINRRKFMHSFPDEYQVFMDWHGSPNERDFYGADLIARGEKERTDMQDPRT